ncbi:MAG TPA: aspartate aminotransferase family protein [Planctomycetota bacterium]|nr:aspartate aminotransferase family protein [Planctomycetota bacterium]
MNLVERDARVLWHPYTQAAASPEPLPILAAEGAYLRTEDGRTILDGVSSWWVSVHGHGHPRLADALARQARTLDHVLFAGATHGPAVELAERLCALTGLDRVFYSDNGSTAVEVALKMAFQYWRNRGERRTRFLALDHAYHGDTVGAMSVSGIPLFRDTFENLLFTVERYRGEISDDVAAVLVEPILQGAGGMRVHPPAFLAEVAARCRAAGTLLVADEVLTGFGRTGRMFACEHADVRPDIACLAKGLTGMLPFAATLATEEIYAAFLGDRSRTFFHGHSFTGNPLGCAVAIESLRIFEEEPVLARAREIGRRLQAGLDPLRGIAAVRGVGAVWAVEVPAEGGYLAAVGPRMAEAALERAVLLRPLGNVLYAMPPFCLTDGEADRLARVMVDVVREVAGGTGGAPARM